MPLALHSEEIHDYNFTDPKPSRHLWLYEGTTEYFSKLLLIRSRTLGAVEFLQLLEQAIREMKGFDNSIPLTSLSLEAMKQQDQYYNFYLRGMLINLCLDIRLRELSGGQEGTQELVRKLLDRYGEDRPFKDEALFDEIAGLTGGEPVRDFFTRYVETGGEPPLREYLEKVGVIYDEKLGELRLNPNATDPQLALRQAWMGQ